MDKSKVYMTKQIGERVECYDRTYCLLGVVDSSFLSEMEVKYNIINTWKGYTGGNSVEPGNALWWKTYE